MLNMNEMMNAMMEKMMENMMESMMTAMMNSMMTAMDSSTPTVANAEAVEQPKKTAQTLTREEFLAMAEATPATKVAEVEYENLDVVAYGNKMVKYNQRVNSNIWQYTDMVIKNKYNGRGSKYRGEYVWVFDNPSDRTRFLQCFEVKTNFDDEELKAIQTYKKNKEVARAKKVLESAEQ